MVFVAAHLYIGFFPIWNIFPPRTNPPYPYSVQIIASSRKPRLPSDIGAPPTASQSSCPHFYRSRYHTVPGSPWYLCVRTQTSRPDSMLYLRISGLATIVINGTLNKQTPSGAPLLALEEACGIWFLTEMNSGLPALCPFPVLRHFPNCSNTTIPFKEWY